MRKQLTEVAFWIGIVSTAIALIMRALTWMGVLAIQPGIQGGKYYPLSYRTFLEGAVLFFVMAIASAVVTQAKERKA